VPIYQTAYYQVNPGAVDRVKAAIAEFVEYVTNGSSLQAQQTRSHSARDVSPAAAGPRSASRSGSL